MKSSRIIKNIVILIIAPFIALGLLFLVRNLSWLTASVLDIWEIQKVKDEWWDLAYKSEWWIFEVFGSEKVQSAESVNIRILYNPEKIELDTWVASWVNYEILNENLWSIEISLTDIKDRDYKEWWFEIPYSWDMTQILLGDSQKEDKKWNKTPLSVGNLNSLEEHSVLP
jgi:hypothetical protein